MTLTDIAFNVRYEKDLKKGIIMKENYKCCLKCENLFKCVHTRNNSMPVSLCNSYNEVYRKELECWSYWP